VGTDAQLVTHDL